MMSSVVIHAAHATDRESFVAAILRELPDATVLRDDLGVGDHRIGARRGCWPMARRAWLSYQGGATHHLVLEDDAVLCARFVELVAEAIARAPRAAISLFRGARHCSVATVLPVEVISRVVPWSDGEARTNPHHDQVLDMGLRFLGVEHLYARPSLVQHGDVASLLDHPPVRAFSFEAAPLSFDLEH